MTCSIRRPPWHDLTIIRGDSTAVIMRFKTLSQAGVTTSLNLSESNVTLIIEWQGGELVRQSVNDELIVDGTAGTVKWTPIPEDTLQIPEGRMATYRIVRDVIDGERQTLVAGFIVGIGFAGEGGDFSDV